MLRTAHRDIRVIRFTGQLNRRGATFLSMVFRRSWAPTFVHRNEIKIRIHLAPRINMTVLTRDSAKGGSTVLARDSAQDSSHEELPTTMLRAKQVIKREEIVERLVRRGVRIETTTATPAAPGAVSTQVIAPASVVAPRVLLRPPTPGPLPGSVSPTLEAPPQFRGMEARLPQASPGPIDVNHLTDQVVAAIDRRINAYRERLGRG